jgi:pimeloyl-ACP methyl ester carboxylesterase
MLKTMPKQPTQQRDTRASSHSPQAPRTFEPVEFRWILKALGAIVALAVVCGYITLCVVYSRTQWQIVLHPSREVPSTPAAVGLGFQQVHFGHYGIAAEASPQLDGWWIPAGAATHSALLLHSGDGGMSDALPQARALHDAGLNVLLFDYRGYGHSLGQHPTQDSMRHDAESALIYLEQERSVQWNSIVLYGTGVGASLAVELCERTEPANTFPALILDHPEGDLKARALADIRSGFLPARLLFTQNFPLAEPLRTLATPKLLISSLAAAPPTELAQAADPKMTVELPPNDSAAFQQTLRRFLDTYVPTN